MYWFKCHKLIISTYFISIMLVFFTVSDCKPDWFGHLLLQFVLNHILMLIFVLLVWFKAYLICTGSFRKKPDGLLVSSVITGNNKQHMPVCAKMISSWVREVLNIAKACYVSGHFSACCGICNTGCQCFPGVHPGGWRLGQAFYSSWTLFLMYVTTTDWW